MQQRQVCGGLVCSHFEADPESVERIGLDFTDADVTVGPASGDRIVILHKDGRGGRRLFVQQQDGAVLVGSVPFQSHWFLERLHIGVLIPEAFHGDLRLHLQAGRARVGGLNLHQVDCRMESACLEVAGCTAPGGLMAASRSGKLELANVDTGDLVLTSASGDICCERVVCSRLTVSSHSGRQRLGVHAAEGCRLTAKSGALHFEGSTPKLETDTRSGAQHLLADCLHTADLKAVSGTLKLTVPESPDLNRIDVRVVSGHALLCLPRQVTPVIDMQAVRGGIHCRRDDFPSGGRAVQINARMTSGCLRVSPAAVI